MPDTNIYQSTLAYLRNNNGIASSNRFKIEIFGSNIMSNRVQDLPQNPFLKHGIVDLVRSAEKITFAAHQAQLKGIDIASVDARRYGPTVKLPYIDIYSELLVVFNCTNKSFQERRFFDAWIASIIEPDTHDINFLDEYSSTMRVWQLNRANDPIYGMELLKSFPIRIADQDIGHDSEPIQRLPVTFSFDSWRVVGVEKVK